MAQNDRLENLVDEVVRESSQFASFDDYLAAQKKGTECQKDVSGAEVNSSPESNEKADETVASLQPTSAEPVSEVIAEEKELSPEEKEAERQRFIEMRKKQVELKTEPVHPIAIPVVTPEPPPVTTASVAPTVTTKLKIQEVDWAGQHATYISEVSEIDASEPDWWKAVFNAGKKLAIETASLDEVLNHNALLEEAIKKIRRSQQGIRAGLDQRTHGANAETRDKVAKGLNENYLRMTNKKSADRMKVERAPKAGPNPTFKLVDSMQSNMGMDAEEITTALEAKGKMDGEVRAYIAKKFGGA